MFRFRPSSPFRNITQSRRHLDGQNVCKSRLYASGAYDGDNTFELVSYFKGGISNTNSFKFGITGDVTYQPMATASTVTMPIELTVTLD